MTPAGARPSRHADGFQIIHMTDDNSATRLNDGEKLEIAEPEDFGIRRNDDGELKPVKQRIPGTDKAILCKPVVDSEPVEEVLEAADPTEDDIDALADEYIVEGLGASGALSDYPDYLIQGVLQAVKNASGNDVFLAAQNQRVEENLAQLDVVGEEDLEKLKAFADGDLTDVPQP